MPTTLTRVLGGTDLAITVERVVPAPPEAIFDLLAHPDRHPELDGSGTVVGPRRSGRRVGLGDRFGMEMHWGVRYATRNIVTEFEEGRRIRLAHAGAVAAGPAVHRPDLALRARARRGRDQGPGDLGR